MLTPYTLMYILIVQQENYRPRTTKENEMNKNLTTDDKMAIVARDYRFVAAFQPATPDLDEYEGQVIVFAIYKRDNGQEIRFIFDPSWSRYRSHWIDSDGEKCIVCPFDAIETAYDYDEEYASHVKSNDWTKISAADAFARADGDH